MSKILKELVDATELNKKRGESDADHVKRVLQGVAELKDAEWDDLSSEAQEWFNAAADAVGAKKDIPPFPDAEPKVEEEKSTGRRRGAAKAEKPAEPKVGDVVKIVTRRGKEAEGELIELDDEVAVLEVGGEEQEFQRSRIESITVVGGEAPKEEAKAEKSAEPKVGDVVTVLTKRGKEETGTIVELDAEVVVLDVVGEEKEFQISRVESITVSKAKEDNGSKTTRSRGTQKEEKPAKE